jgi:type IV pilus assembly protein PilW
VNLAKASVTHNGLRRQQGLGLVEIMIAMMLVAVMFNGLMEIFLSSRQTYNATDNLTRLQENGRTTVDILVAGLRRSGYLGGNSDPTSIAGSAGQAASAATCATGNTTWARMISQPVYGLDDTAAGYDCIDSAYLGGDILTLRYASPWVVATGSFVGTRLYLRSSLFEGKIFPGSAAANNLNVVFDTPQRQHELLSYAYYVADTNRTCNGVAIPGLFREALDVNNLPASEELIAGIENIQFQYNIGNQYVDADAISLANWDNVVSVKLWVLVRAECPETGYTDGRSYVLGDLYPTTAPYVPADSYRRMLFSTVVALRN